MTLTQLKKQLLRDLQRSPKKAAFLGIACLAAIYFWAPLVSGWVSPPKPPVAGEANQTHEVAQAGQAASPGIAGTAATPAAKGPQYDWKQLAAAIEGDPRMRAVEMDLLESEAFGRRRAPETEPAEMKRETAVVVVNEEEQTPEKLGLSLTGAMIGPRRRVAIINGHACVEGSQLILGDGVKFVVAAVRANEVTLVRGDKQYVLPLVRRGGEGKKDGLVLVRAPN